MVGFADSAGIVEARAETLMHRRPAANAWQRGCRRMEAIYLPPFGLQIAFLLPIM
jgi:hypothetical protein